MLKKLSNRLQVSIGHLAELLSTNANVFDDFFRFSEIKIAGSTTDYVNRIIENVKNGITSGNIDKALEN
jgi:hypothetical protein